jgi:hypothetical protein
LHFAELQAKNTASIVQRFARPEHNGIKKAPVQFILLSEGRIMNKPILISHSSRDNEFVARLCQAMNAEGLFNWVVSHDLRGGSELTAKIHSEIEKAGAFIVIISPDAFNSAWVAEETRYASIVKEKRQQDYTLIALLREGIELGALKWIFSKEPVAIRVKEAPGGIREAMPQILAALGKKYVQKDTHLSKTTHPEPLEELVLELKYPYMIEKEGKRRPAASAELTYIPAFPDAPPLKCREPFQFVSPLGPIEIEELRWYLERYYLWPTGAFKTRAENVEKKLPEWGQELYWEAIPEDICDNIITVWNQIDLHTDRRFTVYADPRLAAGSPQDKQNEADEATALLLGLPWELLHDGNGYLFQGARSVRARRRLPEE